MHAAAGRASGSAALSESATSLDWALASVNFISSNQSSSHTTRVVRIDDAVQNALGRDALSRVVALKIDVEGAEVDALDGANLSIGSASVVFLEVKRDGLTAAALAEKSKSVSHLFPTEVWETHEFFEEIGRKLPPPWGLQWHVLPVRKLQGWDRWPQDRHYDDHVMLRRDHGHLSLALPLEPLVTFEFPPPNFVFPISENPDSMDSGAGSLSGSVGIAVYSPHGFTSDSSLSLFIDGVSVMTAPVPFTAEGDKYARLTVSLDGWAVRIEEKAVALYLECGLLFMGQEVASSGPVRVLGTSNLSHLNQRDVSDSLWFREIYGGPQSFGLVPAARMSLGPTRI